MITYKLLKYGFDDEEVALEADDETSAHLEGLRLSAEGIIDGVPFWNYRMEKWIGEERQRGFRYYQGGVEWTDTIRSIFLNS